MSTIISLRKKLVRIYEEAAGTKYERKPPEGIEESDDEPEERASLSPADSLRMEIQDLIISTKKQLRERGELMRKSSTDPNIAKASLELKNSITKLKQQTGRVDSMISDLRAQKSAKGCTESEAASLAAQIEELEKTRGLIQDYYQAFADEEINQGREQSSGPTPLRFAGLKAAPSKKLDELLPVFENMDEAKARVQQQSDDLERQAQEMLQVVERTKANKQRIADQLNELDELETTIEHKMDEANNTVKGLVKSTEDVRKKLKGGTKCMGITILIIFVLVIIYWLYTLIKKFV